MAIKSLYKDYFQKSRIFMYPLLNIKRGSSVTPIETYMSWSEQFSIYDKKLICLYYLREDIEFKLFEKEKLLNNQLFYDFKELTDDKCVYIFDFNEYSTDWDFLLLGKFSKLSQDYKSKIENFYGNKDPNYAYIESFLYPDKYFKMYSEIIGVNETLLKGVGELCSIPNFDKETLIASIKDLEFNLKMS